jgi:hypothetical protein
MKRIALLILLLGCGMALSAQSPTGVADPWIGTWKLDPSQSQFHNPAPKEQTVRVDSVNQGPIRYTVSGTDADGKAFLESYDGKADGQSYPMAINGLEGGQIAYQKVSDHELTAQGKMSDGTTVANTIILSPDGNTITVKSHRTDSKGTYDDTAVLVKQPQ